VRTQRARDVATLMSRRCGTPLARRAALAARAVFALCAAALLLGVHTDAKSEIGGHGARDGARSGSRALAPPLFARVDQLPPALFTLRTPHARRTGLLTPFPLANDRSERPSGFREAPQLGGTRPPV
jgi:hypothetical protein